MNPKEAILPSRMLNSMDFLSPQEKLNEFKLAFLINKFPEEAKIQLVSLTWEQALKMAVDAEVIRKSLPVWDIAWEKFIGDETFYLKLAEYLERRDRYYVLLKSRSQ